MPNRRSALVLLAAVAAFPIAFQKFREKIAVYTESARLLQVHKAPIPVDLPKFIDSSGQQVRWSNFDGKHLLVNVWATWCPPCRAEMPALDRLKAKLGPGADPEIIALSVDPVSFDQLRAFYAVNGVTNLALYKGDETEVLRSLGVVGLPTTLLLDHHQREIGRLVGPTAWDDPEMIAQLASLVADPMNPRLLQQSEPSQSITLQEEMR